MKKMLIGAVVGVLIGLDGFGARPEELVECPVSDKLRGHENTEWSIAYSFDLTDEKKDLPRVLLVGDSICNGYKDEVMRLLDGRMTVSYWISSYCVTSPGYLRLLSFYLDEAKYDVIHFNNGLHSLQTDEKDYEKGLRAALKLIRAKQPNARVVWATSTPLKDREKTERAKRLNAVATKVVSEFEDVGVDDLFGAMDPLDRERNWVDAFHFAEDAKLFQGRIVADHILPECGESDSSGLTMGGVIVNGQKVCEVERRVEPDGIAMRYRLPDGRRVISGEDTVWKMPLDAVCWHQEEPGAYENLYMRKVVRDIPVGTKANLPITFQLADGTYRLITEANLVDYTDLAVEYVGDGCFRAFYYAEGDKPFEQAGADTTPWRLTIIARDLNALANSDLVRRLCPPPINEKSAALHCPGRCIWQWLPSGNPKYAEQKEWYDRTKALGFEYYLIDDGWKNWRDGEMDQWACLKSVIDYGKSIGVRTAMWVDSKEMPDAKSRRAYLEKVVATGAVGIKIDFIPFCDSKWCKWYEGALRDTADLGLFVDFHGAMKPTGRDRTWPHELAREAIRGHEWHTTRYDRVLPPEHDCILPFTRLVQGHGDYTPVVLEKSQLIHFTWPRQLAQGIVFACPFLCFGDYPQNYLDSPMIEIIRLLSPVYEETVILPGSEIGKCVAMARRSGKRWFVAVENGAQPRRMDIPLSFLGGGKWQMLSFHDDPSGALDFCVRDCRVMSENDRIQVEMQAKGGFVALLSKQGT